MTGDKTVGMAAEQAIEFTDCLSQDEKMGGWAEPSGAALHVALGMADHGANERADGRPRCARVYLGKGRDIPR